MKREHPTQRRPRRQATSSPTYLARRRVLVAALAALTVATATRATAAPAHLGDDATTAPVPNRAPTPRLHVSPTSGAAPLTVTLSARRSRDRDGDPLTFSWNFGDGTVAGGRTARDPAASSARVTHVYTTPGTYVAVVGVADASHVATASRTIVVEPPAPPAPPVGALDDGALEGFGATTAGGAGGRTIRVAEPTEAAVRAAFAEARSGGAIVSFDVAGPIVVTSRLPYLSGAFVTVEGNGATLIGSGIDPSAPILEVSGHDVIVRNLRVRNGGDNLRAQGDGAYNVVFSHVSSTGAADDGISIGYGAHDVTVQWSFLAGNTRSLFVKYGATTDVSIHHTWVMKQWIRGPLVSSAVRADVRNVIVEDWAMWGVRFEADASGNVVSSLFDLGPYAHAIGGKTRSALRLIQSGPVFTAGNVYSGLAEHSVDGLATAPLDAPPVTTLPVADMEPLVRARAGCMPRDDVDQAYIDLHDGWNVAKELPLRLTAP